MHDLKSKNLEEFKSKTKTKLIFKPLDYNLKKSNIVVIFHNVGLYKKIKFYKYKNIKCIIDPFNIANIKNIQKIKHYKLIK